jgi:hypothetical protein
MGFNKKWLSNDNVLQTYQTEGLYGLKKEIGRADAIISEKGLSSDIMDVLLETNNNTAETWNKIAQLIKTQK